MGTSCNTDARFQKGNAAASFVGADLRHRMAAHECLQRSQRPRYHRILAVQVSRQACAAVLTLLLRYIFCHLIGMTSACINPIMYALINDSFRNAFINMLRPFFGPCTKYIAVSPPQQTHTTFSFAHNGTRRVRGICKRFPLHRKHFRPTHR